MKKRTKREGLILNKKITLAILSNLLNIFTEIPHPTNKIVDIMNAIDKVTPLTNDTWHGNFKIIYEGKTVFEWSAGSQIS